MNIDLLTKYDNDREYRLTLTTALFDLGLDAFYELLEKAEAEGKRIHIELTDDQKYIIKAGGCVDGGYKYKLA